MRWFASEKVARAQGKMILTTTTNAKCPFCVFVDDVLKQGMVHLKIWSTTFFNFKYNFMQNCKYQQTVHI